MALEVFDDSYSLAAPVDAVDDLVAEIIERPNPSHGIAGVVGMMIHDVVEEIAPGAAKHVAWMRRRAAEGLAAEWADLDEWYGSTIGAFSDDELHQISARVVGRVSPHVGLNWLAAACAAELVKRADS